MLNSLDLFTEQYKKLTEHDIFQFETITKEIIKTGFIVNGWDTKETTHYNFILKNTELFKNFFDIMGFDFHDQRDKDLYYIKDQDDSYVRNINKNETIILLALRVLYENQKETATLDSTVTIKYEDLNQMLVDINYEHSRRGRAIIRYVSEGLRLLRDHKIIRHESSLDDNSIITIYPSIELILDFKKLDEIVNRKKSLIGGEVLNEIDED